MKFLRGTQNSYSPMLLEFWQTKTTALDSGFRFCLYAYKPNSVQVFLHTMDDHLSVTLITQWIKRHSKHHKVILGTALHRDKDFVVAPLRLPYGFTPVKYYFTGRIFLSKKSVTVRTSILQLVGVTHYHSHQTKSLNRCVRTFL